MNRVFVPQLGFKGAYKASPEVTERVPYDLTPAERFGELVILLPDKQLGSESMSIGEVIPKLRQHLMDFDDDDYILAMGDPTVIAAVVMVASEINRGMIKMLRWDRKRHRYDEVEIDLYQPEEIA